MVILFNIDSFSKNHVSQVAITSIAHTTITPFGV